MWPPLLQTEPQSESISWDLTSIHVSLCLTEEGPTVTVDPERQTISQGQTGSVRCVVTGNPTPSVRWSKVNGELSNRHQVSKDVLFSINVKLLSLKPLTDFASKWAFLDAICSLQGVAGSYYSSSNMWLPFTCNDILATVYLQWFTWMLIFIQ